MSKGFSKLKYHPKGFTLLELIIVIIVIGVLASLALPRMLKLKDGVLAIEALNNFSAIRKLVDSCATQTNDYTQCEKFSQINMEYPGNDPNSHFDYAIMGLFGGGTTGFVIGAQYRGGTLTELSAQNQCIFTGISTICIPIISAQGDFISVHYYDNSNLSDPPVKCGFGKFKDFVQDENKSICDVIARFSVPQLQTKMSSGENI